TGVAQYLFALLRALAAQGGNHRFTLYVLREDLPLFDFAKGVMELVPAGGESKITVAKCG
ncbi:MAG TPA: hypothetical protein VN578_16285, partial [Candidatus Binatia bacterium]|nr:hypothetical protein [Candidatus Binatia bacterium]